MFIAFEDLGAVDAFKKVINGLISGEMLMPFVMGLIASLIGSAGVLACCVGVFFTMPFAMTLYVGAYKQMNNDDSITDAEIITETPKGTPPVPAADAADELPDDEAPTVG